MKEIKVFNHVPTLEDWKIDKQVEKQIRFLTAVHPHLMDPYWNEGRVELRPLKRDPYLKEYIRSFGTWHFNEKDNDALKKFLQQINGKGIDLYFSAFAFDYGMDVTKSNGKKYEKGKINNENALFTSILAMDFDNISTDEFQKEKQRLLDIGIETIDIFSGHGFQSFILLSHRVMDKDIYLKFTSLMLTKGFKVDEAVQDPARMLRMPYSFNCKALDKQSKYYDPISPRIVATTDVNWTYKRYHVTEVFEKLNSLPDVITQLNKLTDIDLNSIHTSPLLNLEKKVEKEKKHKEIEEVKNIRIETLRSVYSMINFEKLPEAVQKMLSGSQEGLRNKVMLFLIPFLRNSLGLSIHIIKEIMITWGERCSPVYDRNFVSKEVDRIYALGFKGKYGKYTEELRKAYGYLEFDKLTKRNKILISNCFFEDMSTLPDGAVRIYLSMKLAESLDGIKSFGKKDIQNYAQVSERTVERNMKALVKMNYVCKRRECHRNNGFDAYYLNPYFYSTDGFTMMNNTLVRLMLNDLSDGELKLYSYFSKIANGHEECWMSQKYLAKKIGKKGQSSISKMTDSLHAKGYISKKTTERDGIKHSVYNLIN